MKGLARLAIALGVVALAAAPALAFKSFPNGAIHAVLTEEVALPAGLSRRAIKVMAQHNFELDWNQRDVTLQPGAEWTTPNRHYFAGDHFDRTHGMTDAEAFTQGIARLRHWREAAVTDLKAGRLPGGLANLGRALHVLQDFYSHSNYVDLPSADQKALEGMLLEGRPPAAPAGLQLTGFDAETGKDVARDPYRHDDFAKDSPTENAEAQRKLQGKTKYRLAYDAALRSGTVLLSDVRRRVGEGVWKRLKAY